MLNRLNVVLLLVFLVVLFVLQDHRCCFVVQTKDREVNFDIETAICVCRSAGYYEHALFLAEKHAQHNWYLKTQLEDVHDYKKALEYMKKLDFPEVIFHVM